MFDLSWKKNVKMKIFFEQVWMEKENKAKLFFRSDSNVEKKTVSQRFEIMFAFVSSNIHFVQIVIYGNEHNHWLKIVASND